jgi:hypothetical protein
MPETAVHEHSNTFEAIQLELQVGAATRRDPGPMQRVGKDERGIAKTPGQLKAFGLRPAACPMRQGMRTAGT